MKNLIIIGASSQAKVIIDMLHVLNDFTIIGIIDIEEKVVLQVMGYNVLGTEEDILPRLIDEYEDLSGILAINDNLQRSAVLQNIKKIAPDFKFAAIVDFSATIAESVSIGEGAIIMPGVVVNNSASIGRFCILNTNSSLDYDCVMEDFSSLASGVTVGGNVTIGHHTAISLGANIIDGVSIGEHSAIGAGATVISSVPAYSVVYGAPAKVMRKREREG